MQKKRQPKQPRKPQKPQEGRVVLNVEDIRVDANPETIASMMNALIYLPSYRKRFEEDPVAHLKEVGIDVPAQTAGQITPERIRLTLDSLTEGGEERAAAILPAVAVVVRVGTRPATAPGVEVGVTVAVGTSTFSRTPAERIDEIQRGLAARQQGQEIKRLRRAKSQDPE